MRNYLKYGFLVALVVLAWMIGTLRAMAAGAIGEDHVACKEAASYVKDVSAKNWESAVGHLKPEQLERQRLKYVRATRATPTIDAEVQMLRRLKLERIRDLESMTGREFYMAHQRAIDEERQLTPTTHKQMRDTFSAKFLGAVEEGEGVIHVLIRTSHETLNAVVSELVIVSMEQEGDRWWVAPEHQEIKVSPLLTGELPEEIGRPKDQ